MTGPADGDASAVPPMQTYAILDAAKVVNLPELLGTSQLEHRCLFKGAAYDELKNVAPWIVRLEDGNDFTRRLFTGPEGINGLWDKEPGIYVRSCATLDEMWRHFRKFTRVQDESGKWFYFRYYEADALKAIFESCESQSCGRFGFMGEVHSLIYRDNNSKQDWSLCKVNRQLCNIRVNPEGLLSAIFDDLKTNKIRKDALDLAVDIDPTATQVAFQAIMRWLGFGFDNRVQLRTLTELDRGWGYQLSGQRRVQDIVQQYGSTYDAYLKIKRLKHE